jgi:hypothetical protein
VQIKGQRQVTLHCVYDELRALGIVRNLQKLKILQRRCTKFSTALQHESCLRKREHGRAYVKRHGYLSSVTEACESPADDLLEDAIALFTLRASFAHAKKNRLRDSAPYMNILVHSYQDAWSLIMWISALAITRKLRVTQLVRLSVDSLRFDWCSLVMLYRIIAPVPRAKVAL